MKSKKFYYEGNPFKLAFRKHFCIICGNKLEKKMHRVTVNSRSLEAGHYDFSAGDTNYW